MGRFYIIQYPITCQYRTKRKCLPRFSFFLVKIFSFRNFTMESALRVLEFSTRLNISRYINTHVAELPKLDGKLWRTRRSVTKFFSTSIQCKSSARRLSGISMFSLVRIEYDRGHYYDVDDTFLLGFVWRQKRIYNRVTGGVWIAVLLTYRPGEYVIEWVYRGRRQ